MEVGMETNKKGDGRPVWVSSGSGSGDGGVSLPLSKIGGIMYG